MERENKKRGRKEEKKDSFSKTSKKPDIFHHHKHGLKEEEKKEKELESKVSASASDKQLGLELGVFDFPWLHGEGIIFKSEELNFEDTFSSSLECTCAKPEIECCWYETSPLTRIPDENYKSIGFEDGGLMKEIEDGLEFESENVDCIWSSLLSQPLPSSTAAGRA